MKMVPEHLISEMKRNLQFDQLCGSRIFFSTVGTRPEGKKSPNMPRRVISGLHIEAHLGHGDQRGLSRNSNTAQMEGPRDPLKLGGIDLPGRGKPGGVPLHRYLMHEAAA